MSNLYKISENLKSLTEDIFTQDGELSEEQEQQLAILETELGLKVESYHWVINSAQADVTMAQKEIERLEFFIKQKEKLQEKLMSVLFDATKEFGIKNDKTGASVLKLGTLTLSTKKNPAKVEITQDEVLMDDMYKTHVITISDLNVRQTESIVRTLTNANIKHSVKMNISKSLIKEDFKNNIPIIGAKLVQEERLTIK